MNLVMSQLGKYKKNTILAATFTTCTGILEILLPFVIAKIIDEGISKGNLSATYKYGGIMIIMTLISLTCGVLSGRNSAKASSGLASNIRKNVFDKIQTFSFSNIDKFSTAGLITRLTTDVTNIQNAFQMILMVAVRSPVTLIASIIMCIIISRKMSLIFVFSIIALSIILGTIMAIAMKIFKELFHKYDLLNADVQENVSAIRVVKAYVREKHENEKFYKTAKKLYDLSIKVESVLAFNGPGMMLVIYSSMIAISWFGAKLIVGGTLTTGELTSLFSYIMSIMMSLMMLSMVFVMIAMSSASTRRIKEVLNETPDLSNCDHPITNVKDGSIQFEHVNFSYKHGGDDAVLSDINLKINSGETIGIIGGTGCGKTSFVNLISRLYDVSSGSIKVGGEDVRNYDIETLRDQVSVVLQNNVLFSGSILDNLRWGDENATEEQCKKACLLACADEFISRLPDGYNTHIEQGGNNVSGGQKQRLCIARALLKHPKILILDDSTSAVDTATDAKIRAAFASEIPETTKIIISQRVSSVMDADRIIVMEDGKINGMDTHENLINSNSIYKEIYESQGNSNGDFDNASGKDGE